MKPEITPEERWCPMRLLLDLVRGCAARKWLVCHFVYHSGREYELGSVSALLEQKQNPLI